MNKAAGSQGFESGKPREQLLAEIVSLRAQLELRSSTLWSIISNASDAIISKDLRGIITSWNESATDMFGYGADEAIGRSILLIVPPTLHDEEADIVRRISLGLHVPAFDTQRVHKDGRLIQISVAISPLHDAAGNVIGAAKIARDISNRHRIESRQRDQRSLVDAALNAARLGTWDLDPANGIARQDRRLDQLYGLPEGETIRTIEQWKKHAHPEDRQAVLEAAERCAATGGDMDIQFRTIWPDGSIHWLHSWGRAVYDTKGQLVRIAGVVADVTDIRTAQLALERSEHRLSSLIAQAPVAIFIKDAGGRYVIANEQCARFRGVSALDFIGRTDVELFGEQGKTAREDDLLVLRTGQSLTRETTFGEFTLLTTKFLLPTSDPANPTVCGIAVDVSDRKRFEDQLAAAHQQAEAANSAKDRFLAALSHELRTPLTPVLGLADSLASRADLPMEVREDLEVIRRNVNLEARLIDDLLDLTRITHGKLHLHREVVNCNDVLLAAIDVCREEARVKSLKIDMKLEAAHSYIDADATRVQQVFWNVLKNAIKFSEPMQTITIRSGNVDREQMQLLVVEIIDQGVGILPTHLDGIFNAFDQGEDGVSRQFGGLGLGLAISRAIVERHGGTIHVTSEGKNRGSTFTIELPTVDAPASVAVAPLPAERAPHTYYGRVLLVEDHDDTRIVVGRVLRKDGYVVKTAASIAAAVEAATAEPFDLLISDMGLPDGDGCDLLHRLRTHAESHPHLEKMVAIAVSGFGREEDMLRSKAAGFHEHLIKPIDLLALQSAVRRALRAR